MKIQNKNKIFFLGFFLVSLVGVVISNILLSKETLTSLNALGTGEFVFLIGILGGAFYSQSVYTNNLKYQLYFGLTRKKVYKNYIITILKLLGILSLYFAIDYISYLIINGFSLNELLDTLKKLALLIPLYIFSNTFLLTLSTIYRNKTTAYIVSVIIFVSVLVLNKFHIELYVGAICLVLSAIMCYTGYKLIMNITLSNKVSSDN